MSPGMTAMGSVIFLVGIGLEDGLSGTMVTSSADC